LFLRCFDGLHFPEEPVLFPLGPFFLFKVLPALFLYPRKNTYAPKIELKGLFAMAGPSPCQTFPGRSFSLPDVFLLPIWITTYKYPLLWSSPTPSAPIPFEFRSFAYEITF